MRGSRRPAAVIVPFGGAAALLLGGVTPAAAVRSPSPGEPNVSLPAGRIFYTNPGTDPSKPNAGF